MAKLITLIGLGRKPSLVINPDHIVLISLGAELQDGTSIQMAYGRHERSLQSPAEIKAIVNGEQSDEYALNEDGTVFIPEPEAPPAPEPVEPTKTDEELAAEGIGGKSKKDKSDKAAQ